MKNLLIGAAVAAGLIAAYVSTHQFALHYDPWPLLCILSLVMSASVCGLLSREAQIQAFSFE
jgi:hypothetical protein